MTSTSDSVQWDEMEIALMRLSDTMAHRDQTTASMLIWRACDRIEALQEERDDLELRLHDLRTAFTAYTAMVRRSLGLEES